jgi:hypothetical protein
MSHDLLLSFTVVVLEKEFLALFLQVDEDIIEDLGEKKR